MTFIIITVGLSLAIFGAVVTTLVLAFVPRSTDELPDKNADWNL